LANILIAIGILFCIIEGLARLMGPQLLPPDQSKNVAPGESLPGEPNLIGDARLGWRVREGRNRQFGVPEETYINSIGLRSPEPTEKSATPRILFVGDSSIYGVRVRDSENISGRVQAIFQSKGVDVEVFNGGCPGYSTWQVIRLLKERALEIRPDWVIIGALWSDTQGADAPDSTRFGGQRMAFRYHLRSYILFQNWRNKRRWGTQAPKPPENDPNAPPEGSHGPEKVAFGLQPVIAPTNRVPLSDYTQNLLEITALVKDNDAKVAFLVLPGVRDLVDGETGDFREGYRVSMRQVAEDLDAPIADMPSQFIGGDERHLFYDDVHPKPPGYDIIAQEIVKQLSLEGL
jgi:lysophospholipase L1-like esterase